MFWHTWNLFHQLYETLSTFYTFQVECFLKDIWEFTNSGSIMGLLRRDNLRRLGANLVFIGNNFPKTKWKQECIPVGCVAPAHWPYLVIWGRGHAYPEGACLGGVHTRVRGMHGIHTPSLGPNSRHTLVNTLPSRNYCCGRLLILIVLVESRLTCLQ